MIIFIKPHKLEKFMWPAFIAIVGTVFGIMAWAVHNNGGSAGDMVHPAVTLSASARDFRFVQCVSAVAGTYGFAADRISDVSIMLTFGCTFRPANFSLMRMHLLIVRSGQGFRNTGTLT